MEDPASETGRRDSPVGLGRAPAAEPGRAQAPPPALADGMAILARRSYTRAELGRRLRERHAARDVEAALERMTELGLLDDRAYACRYVRDRFERRGYGRVRIEGELRARGVAEADVEAAIAEGIEPDREREAAAVALERYLARRSDTSRAREGAFRHLVGRGFAVDLVRDLLGVSL